MRFIRVAAAILIPAMSFGQDYPASAQRIIHNIEKNENQSVLTGHIENWVIARGNARFTLGPGEVTLFDFESGRIAAIVFDGIGSFSYDPPNEVEQYQLTRFTDRASLDGNIENLTIFFTVGLEPFPDTIAFHRASVSSPAWNRQTDASFEIFDHTWLDVTNDILGDLLAEESGTVFMAHFDFYDIGQLVFVENPMYSDVYDLLHLIKYEGSATYDIFSGYSPANDLPSERGIGPIDITRYDIKARIDGNGDMRVESWVHFMPLRNHRRYFQLFWNNRNKLLSAIDSRGELLTIVRKHKKPNLFYYKKDDANFGLVFDRPLEPGKEDSVLIISESNALEDVYGMFFIKDGVYWYPHNSVRDIATYKMTFDCPDEYQVVSCGRCTISTTENGRRISTWEMAYPTDYVLFSVGSFDSRSFLGESLPVLKVFALNQFRHGEMALSNLAYYGELSNADILGTIGNDVTNSLAFFTSVLGPCPFDTIRAVELLHKVGYYSVLDSMGATFGHHKLDMGTEGPDAGQGESVITLPRYLMGVGSPGLVQLSYELFQSDRVGGIDDYVKAGTTSFQWWGHSTDYESDRDSWIILGLAQYSGLWCYQLSGHDKSSYDDLIERTRQRIVKGDGALSVGSKAGPVIMGKRLSSSNSDDYGTVVYDKGAYIFHMIRYLLHDYKTGSDDAFAAFLKDLATKYKGKIITTEKLRALLEEHVGGDMGWFFDQWVYGTAVPEYSLKSETASDIDGKYKVTCTVSQKNVPDNFKMLVPITVLFDEDKYIHFKAWVDQPETRIDLPLLPYKPNKIIFNTYDAVLADVTYR